MPFDPASRVQDFLVFGEFGDVNPPITDSATFTFLDSARMEETFEHDIEGCFLYSRHWCSGSATSLRWPPSRTPRASPSSWTMRSAR